MESKNSRKNTKSYLGFRIFRDLLIFNFLLIAIDFFSVLDVFYYINLYFLTFILVLFFFVFSFLTFRNSRSSRKRFTLIFVIFALFEIVLTTFEFSNYLIILNGTYTLGLFLIVLALTLTKEKVSKNFLKNTPTVIIMFFALIFIFIIKIFVAANLSIHIDEGYTHVAAKGFEKYGELKTSITGIEYKRTPIYSMLNTVFFDFSGDNLLDLRLLNIVVFILFIPILFMLVRNLYSNFLAILVTLIFSLNWYVLIISSIARSYTFALIFEILGLFFLMKVVQHSKDFRKFIAYNLFLGLTLILTALEGHILGLFHLIPLIGLVYLGLFFSFGKKLKMLILSLGTVGGALFLVYIFIIDSSIAAFLLKSFNPDLRLEYIFTFGSLISYYYEIGLIILIGFMIFSIFNFKRNKELGFTTVWICVVLFIQGYLFGTKVFDFRYYYVLLFPVLFMFAFYIERLLLSKKWELKVLGSVILLLFIVSSGMNINKTINNELDWILEKPQPWNTYLDQIPKGSILITDFPQIIETVRPDLETYKLVWYPREDEILSKDVDSLKYIKYNFSEQDLNRFFSYVESNNRNRDYTFGYNQSYYIYTGAPRLMDTQHLEDLKQKDKEIYAMTGYFAFKNIAVDPFLLTEVLLNYEIIMKNNVSKSPYDNRKYSYEGTLNLIKIK